MWCVYYKLFLEDKEHKMTFDDIEEAYEFAEHLQEGEWHEIFVQRNTYWDD